MGVNEIKNYKDDPQTEEDALVLKVYFSKGSAVFFLRVKDRAKQVYHDRVQEYEKEEPE